MEIPEHPLVLLHTQGLQPGVYGDVFTGHHLLPLQDNSTKEKTKIQSNFVIPNHFYKTETELFKCFLSKTILGEKSDKLCPYQIVLKNGVKIGHMLLYKTMTLSNLNLSMPYKTGFNKRETVLVIFQENLTKLCPFQGKVIFCLQYSKTKKESKFIFTPKHNSYSLCQILPLKNNTGHKTDYEIKTLSTARHNTDKHE